MTPREPDASGRVLSVLGNATRRGILRELYHAHDGWEASRGLAFSELRDRVDAPDAATFSYHLDRLVGEFVEKVDGRYRPALERVPAVSRVLTWSGLEHEPRGPVDTGYDCDRCDGTLEARYRNQRLCLFCDEGDERHYGAPFPVPYGAACGRELPDLVPIGLVLAHHQIECLGVGACPLCYGVVDAEVWITKGLPGPDPEVLPLAEADNVDDDDGVRFAFTCRRCGDGFGWSFASIARFALHAPEGRAFLRRHDLDPLYVPRVHSLFAEHLDTGFVASRDPVRLETTLSVGDETLTFTLDEAAAIVDRSDASARP